MISIEMISKLRTEFKEYLITIKSALNNDNPIVEKTLLHTQKVVENITILADYLELSENEKHLAEIIARFHDIGRLWLLLPGNSETKITDHAEASVEYLNKCQTFVQLDETTQNIVMHVIKNHNKPDLPRKDGEAVLFYVKLLRDADKLDAWRSTSENIARKDGKTKMALDFSLSDKPIVSPLICKTILNGNIPSKSEIITCNDFIIFRMAWIFELHFKKSFQILNQKQYIRKLYDSLPKNDNVIEIYRMIRIHIENHI